MSLPKCDPEAWAVRAWKKDVGDLQSLVLFAGEFKQVIQKFPEAKREAITEKQFVTLYKAKVKELQREQQDAD